MAATTTQPPIEREALRRLQAREDYINMELKGNEKRSVKKLYDRYVADARRDPENAHRIPTRNKEQIYKWAREDSWDTHALNRDMEMELIALQSMEKVRVHGRQRMGLLVDESIDAYANILKTGADKDRIAVARDVFSMVGLNPLNSGKEEDLKKSKPGGPKAPGPNASEAELLQYASDIARQGLNA